jgi:hypothetical protein
MLGKLLLISVKKAVTFSSTLFPESYQGLQFLFRCPSIVLLFYCLHKKHSASASDNTFYISLKLDFIRGSGRHKTEVIACITGEICQLKHLLNFTFTY